MLSRKPTGKGANVKMLSTSSDPHSHVDESVSVNDEMSVIMITSQPMSYPAQKNLYLS